MVLSTFLFTRIQYLPSLLDRMELQMTYQQMERYQACCHHAVFRVSFPYECTPCFS